MAETEPLTYSVTEAAQVLGISRTTAYECVRTGELRAVRLGRRLVVPKTAITALLDGPTPTAPSASTAEPVDIDLDIGSAARRSGPMS